MRKILIKLKKACRIAYILGALILLQGCEDRSITSNEQMETENEFGEDLYYSDEDSDVLDYNDSDISELDDNDEMEVVLLPDDLPNRFIFSSGGGGWGTQLFLQKDGSFTGLFTDSNPDISEYCYFSGTFWNIEKINDYSYSMLLSDVAIDEDHEPVVEEGYEWVLSDTIYGFDDDGYEYILYTPDTPVSVLEDDFMFWTLPIDKSIITDTLNCYGLYDASGEGHYGFFEYEKR